MEKIVEKIRKLLAVANCSGASESEADTALKMAQELMLKHNIKEVQDKVDVKAVRGEWRNYAKLDDRWHDWIAGAVAKLYNCRSVQRGNGTWLQRQFVGKPENIEVCELTYVWVCAQVEVLYRESLRAFKFKHGPLGQKTRGNFRKSFKEACATRVCQRVNEIIAAARHTIPDHMALVVIDQSLAAADDLLAGIKTAKASKVRSGFGTGAGLAAGDQVKLQGRVTPQPKQISH